VEVSGQKAKLSDSMARQNSRRPDVRPRKSQKMVLRVSNRGRSF